MHNLDFEQVWLYDFGPADIAKNEAVQKKAPQKKRIQSALWFLPEIDNPFYGGIHTILRLADKLHQEGIRSSFLIDNPKKDNFLLAKITEAFPSLSDSRIYFVPENRRLDSIPEHDISICTLWTTAYLSLKFNRVRRKFYMIQDAENFFYPAGFISGLVEATYRFGFLGICNTEAIAEYYRTRYGAVAEAIQPAVDHAIFHAGRVPSRERFEDTSIFFYGRPGHPRNAFGLGISALRKVKKQYGIRVRIVAAGSSWKPEDYGLDGIIENLGVLKYHQTGDLYRKCDIGLSMMFTPHPSYLPFQLMACGVAVVTNKNESTEWFFKDRKNCLVSPPTATCLFESINSLIVLPELRNQIVQGGLETIKNYGTWEEQMNKIYRFIVAQTTGTSA
ncbi:MAG: glycosyltransferase family 4 protein [Patescibacteria group bacterium]|nr:glycosyltransferase family 4 protein [Patescibacteria group bacterium]